MFSQELEYHLKFILLHEKIGYIIAHATFKIVSENALLHVRVRMFWVLPGVLLYIFLFRGQDGHVITTGSYIIRSEDPMVM